MKKEEKKAITYYTLHELYSIGCILWSDERRAKSAEREDSPTDASSKTHASQAMTKAQVRRDGVSFFVTCYTKRKTWIRPERGTPSRGESLPSCWWCTRRPFRDQGRHNAPVWKPNRFEKINALRHTVPVLYSGKLREWLWGKYNYGGGGGDEKKLRQAK